MSFTPSMLNIQIQNFNLKVLPLIMVRVVWYRGMLHGRNCWYFNKKFKIRTSQHTLQIVFRLLFIIKTIIYSINSYIYSQECSNQICIICYILFPSGLYKYIGIIYNLRRTAIYLGFRLQLLKKIARIVFIYSYYISYYLANTIKLYGSRASNQRQITLVCLGFNIKVEFKI